MGCSVCQGHAHQVCGAPGCHDETQEVKESMRQQEQEWKRIPNVIACSRCMKKPAIYFNGRGAYRCDTCPKTI